MSNFNPSQLISKLSKKSWMTLTASLLGVLLLIWKTPIWLSVLRTDEALSFIGEHLPSLQATADLATAVACFIYGFVIIILRSRTEPKESWAGFLGALFILLAFQHFLLPAMGLASISPEVPQGLNLLLSAGGNYLLVSTGLSLLDREPFPSWNFMVQAIFFICGLLLLMTNPPWRYVPDALASALSFYWLGYGLYRNIKHTSSRLPNWARVVSGAILVICIALYSIAGMVGALTHVIVQQPFDRPSVTKLENAALKELVRNPEAFGLIKEKEKYLKQGTGEAVIPKAEIRQLWIGLAITLIVFTLKFVIFAAALYLLLGATIFVSSQNANTIFNPILHGIEEFLSPRGFTSFVAEKLDAAAVSLYLKIPGNQKNQYMIISWPVTQAIDGIPEKLEESVVDKLAHKAMQQGRTQKEPSSHEERLRLTQTNPLTAASYLPTKVVKPIYYHDAVIGSLMVTSKIGNTFSPRDVQHVKDLAKLAALPAQALRENSALDQLNFRFSRILTPNPVTDFAHAIDQIAEVLHDVLNPLATGLWIDTGLKSHESFQGGNESQRELKKLAELGKTITVKPNDKPFRLYEIALEVKLNSTDEKTYRIGKLALLAPATKDALNQPFMGRDPLHLKAINARAVSAVLGVMMEYLSSVLQTLSSEANLWQSLSAEECMQSVKTTSEKAGIAHIAIYLKKDKRWLGNLKDIAVIQQLKKAGKAASVLHLRPARLTHINGTMYIAVRGGSYNNGENVCPLWLSSFIRFAEITDSALTHIQHQREKMEILKRQADQAYELATIAVTTGEINHEIVNATRNLHLPLQVIREAMHAGKIVCADKRYEHLIETLPQSADCLLELTADFKKLSDPDENPNCHLRQAVELVERLFALPLKHRHIFLMNDVADELIVAVPPHVAVLALATLISNAKDAVPEKGVIKISACRENGHVRCDVTDNGGGIADEVLPRLFHERNITTKPNGNGWGLYLINRSLRDRHASIELTTTRPGETIFTLRFPQNNGAGKS